MPDAAARRRRRILGAVLGVTAGVVIVGVLVTLVGILALAAQMRDTQKSSADTIDLIESCTTAGGECYEASNERTGNVIEVLNDFTTYVIACADRPGTQDAASIKACAVEALRKAESDE